MTVAATILRELREAAFPEKEAVLRRFFKTGPGEYGEGDRFLGVMVPQIRTVAKAHPNVDDAVVGALLASPWHEVRECALLLLVERFGRANEAERTTIHSLYLAAATEGRVNNWDLVDLSAPTLVGRYLFDRPRGLLDRLARRPCLFQSGRLCPVLPRVRKEPRRGGSYATPGAGDDDAAWDRLRTSS